MASAYSRLVGLLQIVEMHSSTAGPGIVLTAEFLFATSVDGGGLPQVDSPPRVHFVLEYFNTEKEQIFEEQMYVFYNGSIVMELSESGQLTMTRSGTATNASV
jgi:hypothetical protein